VSKETTIDLETKEGASDSLNRDMWRAVVRPLALEMYYSGFTSVEIIVLDIGKVKCVFGREKPGLRLVSEKGKS